MMDRQEELLTWIAAFREGQLTPEEAVPLNDLLASDAEARELWVVYLLMQTHLESELAPAHVEDSAANLDLVTEATYTSRQAADKSTAESPADLPTGACARPGESATPKSPVFGFFGEVGRRAWGYVGDHTMLLSALAALILVALLVTLVAWNRDDGRRKPEGGSEIVDHKSEISNPKSDVSDPSPLRAGHLLGGSVLPAFSARLVRDKDCHWNGQTPAPEVGQTLPVGQPLGLASGVAEIEFDIGAKVILQSPAAFELLSANSARLEMGKATVEIKNQRARGFKILTPDATFVDQGTEFGVEVAPGGSSKVHVFKGLVDVDRKARAGRDAPLTQRLAASVGALMEPGEEGMTLVQDTGECFIRSMDDADRDRHVVAYWRFEDRPLGSALPHSSENTNPTIRATTDSTFNGNDLFTYHSSVQPVISGDVPTGAVPQTGSPNRGCVDNTIHGRDAVRPDLYTKSRFSHAAPLDIQKVAPVQWTIEVSVKANSLRGAVQTFVGRDGCDRYMHQGPDWITPRLAFQINEGNRFAIRFVDGDNRPQQAVAEQLPLETGRWYNLSAASDGRTLRLYVDVNDGQGYRLQAQTALPKTGSTALSCGSSDAEWSIGRGCDQAGWAGEHFDGWIDEVRISDIAREPSGFLFTLKEQSKQNGNVKMSEYKR